MIGRNFFQSEANFMHDVPANFWSLVALSTILWAGLYSISEHLLPSKYIEMIKASCTPSEWKDIRSRLVSNIHALYSCFIAIYFYKNDPKFQSWDIVYTSDSFSLASTGTLGYFLYDYLLIMTDFESLGGLGMFCHHVCVVSCLLGCCYYRVYHIVVVMFCLSEITTPFVNARVIMLKMGMKDSPYYVLNGLFMFLGFVLFRFSLVFILPYMMLSQIDTIKTLCGFTNMVSFIGYLGMSFLNSMWTYKIFIGLLKAVQQESSMSSPEEVSNLYLTKASVDNSSISAQTRPQYIHKRDAKLQVSIA